KGTPLNLPLHFNQAIDMLPSGIRHLLANYGVTNMASVQKKLADGAAAISQTAATQAFSLGQNMFQFVVSFAMMMYMVFFLLRDG
ncbi:AI-2E family transporter, partial [Klebsiella variicola]|nr:AI-2E family transporter [Klebsiella variicola]